MHYKHEPWNHCSKPLIFQDVQVGTSIGQMPLDHAQLKRRSNKQVPGTTYVPKDTLAPAPSRAASYLRPLLLCPEQRPEAQHHHRVGPAAPPKSIEQESPLGTQLVSPDAHLGKECNADTCALHLPHALYSLQGASHKEFAHQHGSPQNKPAAWPYNTSQQSAKVKVSSSTSPDSPFWSHDARAKVHALTMIPPLSPSGQ